MNLNDDLGFKLVNDRPDGDDPKFEQVPTIQSCGHAHTGDRCPLEGTDDYAQHMMTACGSYICCIN